jgi:hypothetical protein
LTRWSLSDPLKKFLVFLAIKYFGDTIIMTVTATNKKQELIGKFAQQTGADVPGVDRPTTDVHINTESSESAPEASPELYQDSFSHKTKLKAWENPKYRTVMVGLCVLPAILGIGWVLKDGIPKPVISTRIPPSSTPSANPDDDKPKPATDGEWSSLASTNGMHQQFKSAAHPETGSLDGFKKGLAGKEKDNMPGGHKTLGKGGPMRSGVMNSSSTSARPHVIYPNRMARVNSVPMDNIPSSRPLVRPYTPLARPSYSPPVVIPRSAPVSRSSQTSSFSAKPEQSAQQRRLAAIAATSTSGGSASSASVSSAGTPPNSGAPGTPGTSSDPVAAVANGQTHQSAGYQDAGYLSSEAAVIEGIPQQLISRSQKAQGRLLLGVAFTPGDAQFVQDQPLEVEIQNPLQSGLPQGSRIVANVKIPQQSGQAKNSAIRLIPSAIAIGDAEYPLPQGAIVLTGENGKPLIAKRQGSEFLRFLSSTAKSAAGGLGGLTSLAFGNGTGILSALSGFNPLSNIGRTNQQPTEILALREGTVIQINVVKPLSLPASPSQISSEALPVSVAPGQAPVRSVAVSPTQPMMFKQDLNDAELMAIATHQESANQSPEQQANQQPEQPQQVEPQVEVQDAQ